MWVKQNNAVKMLTVLAEAAPALHVGATVPRGWSREDAPVITVHSDGTPDAGRAQTVETVRVSVRAKERRAALGILEATDAWLADPRTRPPRLGCFEPATNLIAARDPALNCWIASANYIFFSHRKAV